MDWRERDHPRDPDGQFTDKSGWAQALVGQLVPGDSYRPGRDITGELDWAAVAQKAPPSDVSIFSAASTRMDDMLGEIYQQQGYHGKPSVVKREQMDRLVKEGWTELWRGVSHPDPGRRAAYAQQFRTGDEHRPGLGGRGNGTYTSRNPREAQSYTTPDERWHMTLVKREDGSHAHAYVDPDDPDAPPVYPGVDPADTRRYPGLLRMALRPDARLITWRELEDMWPIKQRESLIAVEGGWEVDEDRMSVIADEGRLAAALGYDAIIRPGSDHIIILNRTAVVVQEAQ